MNCLIDASEGSFILALRDKAYLLSTLDGPTKDMMVELASLESSSTSTSTSTPTQTDNQSIQQANESQDNNHNDNTQGDPITPNLRGDDIRTQKSETELNQVHVVGITHMDSILYCAVARGDKTLSLYKQTTTDESSSPPLSSTTLSTLLPFKVYTTPKRVSCMKFAFLPSSSSSTPVVQPELIVIAGDMAGDAYAYRLYQSNTTSSTVPTTDTTSPSSNCPPRLLLGHTASMLTGIAMSQKSATQNQAAPNQTTTPTTIQTPSLLLTADRDEKIRVSSFPFTAQIEGFLLGHEAYVTSIVTTTGSTTTSTSTESLPMAISGSGDSTLRLWNLKTFEQVQEVSLDSTTSSSTPSSSSSSSPPPLIPTQLCLNPTGQYLAVTFDQSPRVDFYRLLLLGDENVTSTKNNNIQWLQTITCSTSTLGVAWYGPNQLAVLLRDPEYLATFTVQNVHDTVTVSPTTTTLPLAIQQQSHVVSSSSSSTTTTTTTSNPLVMPLSILERDNYGQIKLTKLHETRGPAAGDEPWNRVERVGIAKEANKRHKRRRRGILDVDGEEPTTTPADNDDDDDNKANTES